MHKILIVEDDTAILKGLKENLEAEHFTVLTETDGEKGLQKAISEKHNLIILDVMLPSKNGFDICREIRGSNNNTPIIILTGKSTETDKVRGLELGADDYITKPFSILELIARIKAILRRVNNMEKENETLSFGDVVLDFKKMEARKGEKNLEMSLKEFEIMKYFSRHEGEVISRNQLLDEVWGYDVFPTTRTVDNYMLMLRKKFETNPSVPKHILTMHLVGYKFITK